MWLSAKCLNLVTWVYCRQRSLLQMQSVKAAWRRGHFLVGFLGMPLWVCTGIFLYERHFDDFSDRKKRDNFWHNELTASTTGYGSWHSLSCLLGLRFDFPRMFRGQGPSCKLSVQLRRNSYGKSLQSVSFFPHQVYIRVFSFHQILIFES